MARHLSTPSVFISYRRQDAEAFAGRLYDKLAQEFGEDRVFMDVDTLEPGDDYIKAIERKLRHIDVFLAIIGDRWLTITDERGAARLSDEKDLLRIEVATALKRNARVIPVLVGGATMPKASDLPADLANISRLHAFELTGARFRADAQLLVNSLRGGEPGSAPGYRPLRKRSWITPLSAIQPLLLALSGLMLHIQAETEQSLYSTAKLFFFGGLPIGGLLAVLGWRSHNNPGVCQGAAYIVVAVGAALALDAIGELPAQTCAYALYTLTAIFGALAWWTIRTVPFAPLGTDVQSGSGQAASSADRSVSEGGRPSARDAKAPHPRPDRVVHARRSGTIKRISAYWLVALDLLGLFLFVIAAVAMWTDLPRRVHPKEALAVASLTIGPGIVSLILFGWIAEIRLCWMLGVTTLVPFGLLIATAAAGAQPFLFALTTLVGITALAFAVETLRRLRKLFVVAEPDAVPLQPRG